MENILYIIIILLAVVLVFLMTAIVVFLFRFLKIKETSTLQSNPGESNHPSFEKMPAEVKETITKAKEGQILSIGSFCVDHPDLAAIGRCSISDDLYCELCLTKEKDVKIARKYISLFLDFEWPVFSMLNNNEVGANRLNEVMRVKKELWKERQLPIITQRQFKINIENDEIEIFTVIMIRESDKEIADQRLGFLNDH